MNSNRFRPLLVILLLSMAALACFQQSRSELNSGKGSRENPVAPRKYAVTPDFSVTALSVVRRPLTAGDLAVPEATAESGEESVQNSLEFEYMRVQFQVKCNLAAEKICDLSELSTHLQLVSDSGILYNPTSMESDDPLLEGEILGDAEKTGWLVFRVPIGLSITTAVARYGDGEMVFFKLP